VSVTDRIDRWIVADARRHQAGRDRGAFWQATLPGSGFWKVFAFFIVVPLLALQVAFVAGLPVLPPKLVMLAIFGVIGVYFGRYFAHRAAIRSGKLPMKEGDR
jgi:hypothetical protein